MTLCTHPLASSSNVPTLTAEDISIDGVILQRFPATDRKEAALPAGIAMVRISWREREREREREVLTPLGKLKVSNY